jgi:hypothetical protein
VLEPLLLATLRATPSAGARRDAAPADPLADDPGERWRERVRGVLSELLEFADHQPEVARRFVREPESAAAMGAQRARVLALLRSIVDQGRDSGGRASPPPATADGVIAGALGAVHGRMLQGDPESLVELLDPLMGFIVLPYLGASAARQELSAGTPSRARRPD